MKHFILALVLFSGSSLLAKDDPKYPVSQIPENMKTGMYAVIRHQETRITVQSIKSSSYYSRVVVTLLNPKAKFLATKTVWYDKLTTIKYLRGTVYDAAGNVVRKLKPSDIYDHSAYDGFTMYSDNRIKRTDFSQPMYPYTVEFEFEKESKMLYDLPDFHLYHDDEVSIQKSVFSITYPVALKPRYKLFKIDQPKITQDGSNEKVEWTFENIIPDKFEKFAPDITRIVPNISVAPNQFEYEGYTGNMNSWEEYGKWNAQLNKGRDELPDATKQKVLELTKNLPDEEAKIKVLYEYLQGRTRYVGIQLGIGGLQPFPASVVDQTGYGDCKALSNYMVALLKVIGIKGYYTVVNAGKGEDDIDIDFPSHQSNHVIVAVPLKSDTIWLECTNQTSPFNYQGTFTGDRKALMITEDGGKLVNTHQYRTEENLQSRVADVFVEKNGDAKATVKTTYAGIQYENDGLDVALTAKTDEQKKWVQKNTAIPSFDISSFSMTNNKSKIPVAEVKIDLVLNRFSSVSGKRLFLTPNLMNRSTFIPEKLESRKTNIVLRSTFLDIDTIRYHLPEDIYPEFLPEPVLIKSVFGEYESKYLIDQGSVVYIRKMKRNKGEFPAETYNSFIDFYKNINKSDNTKIVFLSKT